jgi:thioredoxin 1
MKTLIEITSKKKFESAKKQGPVLIDFYTEWCKPCKIQAEVLDDSLEEILSRFPELQIYRIDINCDNYFERLSEKIGIRTVPHLILFLGKRKSGYSPGSGFKTKEEIIRFLSQHL